MICKFKKLIYPYDVDNVQVDSYVVALYECDIEDVEKYDGKYMFEFCAVGYGLPITKSAKYNLNGEWKKDKKYGIQYKVSSFEQHISHSKEGIIAYLSSGQIKGIGVKLAEKIYDTFGEKTLETLDKSPELLLDIPGIKENKLKKIIASYTASRGARDIIAFLAPYGLTTGKILKFYKQYGSNTLDVVKNHPYKLCELSGIGFRTADNIASNLGLNPLSSERVDSAILYTLANAEVCGHLCLTERELFNQCINLLKDPKIPDNLIKERVVYLVDTEQLCVYNGHYYNAKTAKVESALAKLVKTQTGKIRLFDNINLDQQIEYEESVSGITFAPEQRAAIKTALTNKLSIITGGPGTGKTLIQRAILNIYHRLYPAYEICCCAPTGRAARRMNETTGFYSSTIHKALCLFADDDGEFSEPEGIEADLVLVDECSMLDIFLAYKLFHALAPSTQLILIGDADQLPSVGPGAVLSELIDCGNIPVIKFDKIFRQDKNSRIAVNAAKIRHGDTNLDYGDDFKLVHSSDLKKSADLAVKIYKEEVDKYGIDNVVLLSPFRQKTETGTDALNESAREKLNPDNGKIEVSSGKKVFRSGDKIMQMKNLEDINNGDIGYIEGIYMSEQEFFVDIDFKDGRRRLYDKDEFSSLDLGYASTIHKSQGSEYHSVIICCQSAHHIMLKRPLLYTAITRGKEKVTIVGEKYAIEKAIKTLDTEKRGTFLADKIKKLFNVSE